MLFEFLGLMKASYDLHKAECEMYREMREEEARQRAEEKRKEELRKEQERLRIEKKKKERQVKEYSRCNISYCLFSVGYLL